MPIDENFISEFALGITCGQFGLQPRVQPKSFFIAGKKCFDSAQNDSNKKIVAKSPAVA